jgi:hypothetical protein
MDKLIVYVHSYEISTLDFIDKEGAMHGCANAGVIAFQRLQSGSAMFGNRYLCDGDRQTLTCVEDFCKQKGLEYGVIDLGEMNFFGKLALRIKGIRTPAVCYRKNTFCGIPNNAILSSLLSKRSNRTLPGRELSDEKSLITQ